MKTNRTLKYAARLCRPLLALTFVFSGFVKTVDPWGTAIKIQEYLSIYGFENLSHLRFGLAIWLCGAELMMGCMLLFKVRIRLVSIFALASMVFFTVLTFLSATWLPVEDCGCFGDAVKLTPWQTFCKNLVLLPMSVVVWWRYRSDRIFAFRRTELSLTLLFFAGSMGLGFWCYRHLPLLDFRPFKVGVNIYERMNAYDAEECGEEYPAVLVYRSLRTGELREFSLDDPEWQDESEWEWVETRTDTDAEPRVDPTLSEFSLRDASGRDVTEELLTRPGRLYMICVNDFRLLDDACARRLRTVVDRAGDEGAEVVCLTPDPLRSITERSFAGSRLVRCCNIDGATLKTMLRAMNGLVVLDGGTISAKYNCRDIPAE